MNVVTSLRRYGVWLVLVWTVGLYAVTSSGCMTDPPRPAGSPGDDQVTQQSISSSEADPVVTCAPCALIRTRLAAGLTVEVNPLCTDCRQCGDGVCNNGETHATCSPDCPLNPPPTCGNGVCDGIETPASCPHDCFCGDGKCSAGENITNCREDCCAHATPPCTV